MRTRTIFRLAVVLASPLTGCHSPYINATVINRSAQPVSLIEVDYPSASFGTQALAPGQSFPYRFKILGSGNLKIEWTDVKNKDHTVTGPVLHDGNEGTLLITLQPDGTVAWQPILK